MLEIFLRTLPFFALIGLGWGAGRTGFFPPAATDWLTRFVFYFALSAMLFRFAATLPITAIFEGSFVLAYLVGCLVVWGIALVVAFARRLPVAEATMEAHCAIIGNTGFLGVPLLVALLGPAAAGPVLMVLCVDLIVFSSLFTLIITASRQQQVGAAIVWQLVRGLVRNPMIVSMLAGMVWSLFSTTLPRPVDDFMSILGAAATPGALFAIGASLADRSADRPGTALWLSLCKLVLHPAAVALAALVLFPVDPFAAGVMVAAAALPVAGNVYILASHYGIAPRRVSASILFSTAASILTVPLVVAWITNA